MSRKHHPEPTSAFHPPKPLYGNNVFSSIDPQKQEKFKRDISRSPAIQLYADHLGKPKIEALVVMSWRDTIISIPRIIIPNKKGKFVTFSIDGNGTFKKPATSKVAATTAFLDKVHLVDTKCKLQRSRWCLLEVSQSRGGYVFIVKDINPGDCQFGRLDRNKVFSKTQQFRSMPLVEVDNMLWFYKDVLKKTSQFLGLKESLTPNSLTSYYQYMAMTPGDFHTMYSVGPETSPTGELRPRSIREDLEESAQRPAPVKPKVRKPGVVAKSGAPTKPPPKRKSEDNWAEALFG